MADLPLRSVSPKKQLGALVAILALAARLADPPASRAAESSSDSLTIAECVALARTHAPEVLARAADFTGAQLDSAVAARNRRPTFQVAGGAMVAPQGFYDPAATNLGEYSTKLEVAVPLLDGGARRRDRAQATLGAGAAAADRDLAARDAGLRAATVAVDLLKRQEIERANREALAWLDRLSSLVESSVRGGGRPRADAVRVRLEEDGVESDLLTAAAEGAALERELDQLIGRAPGTPIAIANPDTAIAAVPTPADSLALMDAVERAPEVRAARAQAARARVTLEQARRKNALAVDLAADAGIWGMDLTHAVPEDLQAEHPGATFGDRLRRDLGASVSLQFHRALLDATAGYARGAEEARLLAADRRATAALADRQREARDLLARWRAASTRSEIARSSLQRASDNLLRMRSLYAGGAASLLELLDARRQWDEARNRLAEARSDARLAFWEGEIRR